jgi:MHS family shikimate/dehydroshikimate transporter-like MFS transporter
MATSNDNTIPGQYMGPVIFSRTLGTAIERYDFFPYGTIPVRLFSKSDPLVSPLLSLFTFLAGFVARPFGGAHFGHLGDRIGRKSTLNATLLLMGLSTLFIGFLPSYATLGVVAPLILVLLRLSQGLGVGG